MRFWAIVALIIFASFGCATPEPTPTPTAEPTPIPTVTPRERFSEDALTLRPRLKNLSESRTKRGSTFVAIPSMAQPISGLNTSMP